VTQVRRLAEDHHRVLPEALVGVGVIGVVVEAAALFPDRGAADDHLRHVGDVAQLEQVARDVVLPVVLADLVLEQRHAARRATQALVGAHDADVVPHEAAQLVPVLADDDALVARHGLARVPLGHLGMRALLAEVRERVRRALAVHEALEQGVRREAVGAVEARRADLADRPEARHARAAVAVADHAAAHVVRGRHDRDRLRREVDAEAQALRVDRGEALLEVARGVVRHVEEDTVGARALHLVVDRARDHVTRREILHRVVTRHEGVAVREAQDAALAAQRLRDEEALGLRVEERGRVELEELHVRDERARAVRHRDAVARRDVGVGRVEVDLARAARREDRGARRDRVDLARVGALGRRVEHVRAGDLVRPAVLRELDEIHGHVVLEHADVRVLARRLGEHALHLAAGHVPGVDHAARGVAALSREIEAAEVDAGVVERVAVEHRARRLVVLLVEARAELDQLLDAGRPALHHEVDHARLREAVADGQRVLRVRLERVARVEHRRDAALRPVRVRVREASLGHDDHLAVLGRLEREGQARDAAPQHQEIARDSHARDGRARAEARPPTSRSAGSGRATRAVSPPAGLEVAEDARDHARSRRGPRALVEPHAVSERGERVLLAARLRPHRAGHHPRGGLVHDPGALPERERSLAVLAVLREPASAAQEDVRGFIVSMHRHGGASGELAQARARGPLSKRRAGPSRAATLARSNENARLFGDASSPSGPRP
jgi:hypothetical protein